MGKTKGERTLKTKENERKKDRKERKGRGKEMGQ